MQFLAQQQLTSAFSLFLPCCSIDCCLLVLPSFLVHKRNHGGSCPNIPSSYRLPLFSSRRFAASCSLPRGARHARIRALVAAHRRVRGDTRCLRGREPRQAFSVLPLCDLAAVTCSPTGLSASTQSSGELTREGVRQRREAGSESREHPERVSE